MATLATKLVTLLDWAKRLDPDGKAAAIVEMLAQTNQVLEDMVFKEGNLPTGERVTIRTGLPTIFWRLLNQGVPTSKSKTAQVDEQCGMMEAYSEVDKDLAELNGLVNEFRLSEASAFLEAMNIEAASTLFYGNISTNPEEFNGFAVRYSDSTAPNGKNIIKGGGAGSDNMSIWLVSWGLQTVHGVFPKGSKAGITHENLGLQTVENAGGVAGNRMRAYLDHFQWKLGLVVKDWRYAVRICNIDVSNLVANSGSEAKLITLMIKAVHRIPFLKMGKTVWYMNRTAFEMLDVQRLAAVGSGGGITYKDVDGMSIPHFRNIPIKICDALLETEAAVA